VEGVPRLRFEYYQQGLDNPVLQLSAVWRRKSKEQPSEQFSTPYAPSVLTLDRSITHIPMLRKDILETGGAYTRHRKR